jgi:hypothetical protein
MTSQFLITADAGATGLHPAVERMNAGKLCQSCIQVLDRKDWDAWHWPLQNPNGN